jgi:hypothetical protein
MVLKMVWLSTKATWGTGKVCGTVDVQWSVMWQEDGGDRVGVNVGDPDIPEIQVNLRNALGLLGAVIIEKGPRLRRTGQCAQEAAMRLMVVVT